MTLRDDGRRCYRLTFGEYDSIHLLDWIYADTDGPCLDRKRAIWIAHRKRHASHPAPTGLGRWARRDSNPHALSSTGP